MSAAGVTVSTTTAQVARAGSTPSTALHSIQVQPVPFTVAREMLVKNHYLHSFPGGTVLAFGTFIDNRLLGAVTFGSGPANAYRLVDQARPEHCLTLSRLWLDDELPANSESRVIGVVIRALRKNTKYKFLVSYADPAAGHLGTVYKASGWLYTGLSQATPMFDIGDGIPRHSRSLSHSFGSHSIRHFKDHGINIRVLPQQRKHRYLYFIDPDWRSRLNVPALPYPKKGESQ